MSSRQEQLEQQKRMQREERADNAASQQASEMSRRQMEEKLHNPQFAETIRDPDLGRKYEKDLGPDTSKAHAVSNLSEDARERVYWKTLNRAERRVTESEPGFLLKENPYLLALAQNAEKPEGIQRADSKPLTSSERRKVRGSYEVSNALKQLGVDSKGLDALTTATAEHRTVTNERESESNVKNRVKAFFD